MISIPTWVLIVLIATNIIVWAVALFFGELVCYIHDMIQVERHYKRYFKGKNKKGRK